MTQSLGVASGNLANLLVGYILVCMLLVSVGATRLEEGVIVLSLKVCSTQWTVGGAHRYVSFDWHVLGGQTLAYAAMLTGRAKADNNTTRATSACLHRSLKVAVKLLLRSSLILVSVGASAASGASVQAATKKPRSSSMALTSLVAPNAMDYPPEYRVETVRIHNRVLVSITPGNVSRHFVSIGTSVSSPVSPSMAPIAVCASRFGALFLCGFTSYRCGSGSLIWQGWPRRSGCLDLAPVDRL